MALDRLYLAGIFILWFSPLVFKYSLSLLRRESNPNNFFMILGMPYRGAEIIETLWNKLGLGTICFNHFMPMFHFLSMLPSFVLQMQYNT